MFSTRGNQFPANGISEGRRKVLVEIAFYTSHKVRYGLYKQNIGGILADGTKYFLSHKNHYKRYGTWKNHSNNSIHLRTSWGIRRAS